jgi:hypothetical protein
MSGDSELKTTGASGISSPRASKTDARNCVSPPTGARAVAGDRTIRAGRGDGPPLVVVSRVGLAARPSAFKRSVAAPALRWRMERVT